jgi:signal transduction histidine kinase
VKKTPSLRTRLLVSLLVSLTTLLATGCAGLYWLQRKLLFGELDRQLDRRAFGAMRYMRPRRMEEPLDPDESPQGLLFFAVWDLTSQKREIVVPATLDLGDKPLVPTPPSPARTYHTRRIRDGREVRILATKMELRRRRPRRDRERDGDFEPPAPPGEPPPEIASPGRPGWVPPPDRLILAAADLAPLRASLRSWLMGLLLVSGIGEVSIVAIVLLAVRRGLKPLQTLATDISGIDETALSHRVSLDRLPPEISPVVGQLNALMARLEAAFDREKAFIASAAHELRTPLAGLRSQFEVCLRRPRDRQEYHRALTEALDTALSIQGMVDALLDSARLERGQVPLRPEAVDVSVLLRQRWQEIEALAHSRELSVEQEIPDALDFRTDGMLLERVVANLLSNAATYADRGTKVSISARVDEGHLRLQIRNRASALVPDDMDKLFDRFWRKDAARTEAGRHTGLGLSVSRQCARMLGGSITAELTDGGSLAMTLDLPPLQEDTETS